MKNVLLIVLAGFVSGSALAFPGSAFQSGEPLTTSRDSAVIAVGPDNQTRIAWTIRIPKYPTTSGGAPANTDYTLGVVQVDTYDTNENLVSADGAGAATAPGTTGPWYNTPFSENMPFGGHSINTLFDPKLAGSPQIVVTPPSQLAGASPYPNGGTASLSETVLAWMDPANYVVNTCFLYVGKVCGGTFPAVGNSAFPNLGVGSGSAGVTPAVIPTNATLPSLVGFYWYDVGGLGYWDAMQQVGTTWGCCGYAINSLSQGYNPAFAASSTRMAFRVVSSVQDASGNIWLLEFATQSVPGGGGPPILSLQLLGGVPATNGNGTDMGAQVVHPGFNPYYIAEIPNWSARWLTATPDGHVQIWWLTTGYSTEFMGIWDIAPDGTMNLSPALSGTNWEQISASASPFGGDGNLRYLSHNTATDQWALTTINRATWGQANQGMVSQNINLAY